MGSPTILLLWAIVLVSVLPRAQPLTNGICWGRNDLGQAGPSTTAYVTHPTFVRQDLDLSGISSSSTFTCALAQSGRERQVYCWGSNSHGQLGATAPLGAVSVKSQDAQPANRLDLDQIATGANHVCGITRNITTGQEVYCWGANDAKQLGNVSVTGEVHAEPVRVLGLPLDVNTIACGNATCCVASAGVSPNISCWGYGLSGMLGEGGVTPASAEPRVITLPASILSLSLGMDHACAITVGGLDLYCWGTNDRHQLGNASVPISAPSTPVLAGGQAYARVSCGNKFTCGISQNDVGKTYCWGRGDVGLINTGIEPDLESALVVPAMEGINAAEMSAGANFACALERNTWLAFCWGNNADGQMGNGQTSALNSVAASINGTTFSPYQFSQPVKGTTFCTLKSGQFPIPSPQAPFVRPIFDAAEPSFQLLGVENSGVVRSDLGATFAVKSMDEIDVEGNQAKHYDLSGWTLVDNNTTADTNGSASYTFRTVLNNNVTVSYSFETFNASVDLDIGGNFSLPINPALLKFTLRLSAWPWTSPGNTLRLRLNVAPSFADFVESADTPKFGVTSFHLLPPASAGRSMLVRVLNFAFAEEGATKVQVSASANSTTSSLTINLPYFAGDLVYDPDFGLLVTGKENGDGSDDNLGLIIGVSVAVPVAVGLVLVVVLIATAVWVVQKRRARSAATHVNFSSHDGTDQADLL